MVGLARVVRLCILCAALAACGGEMPVPTTDRQPHRTLADVTDAQWARLAERHIFFGHQSVGDDLIGGIEALLRETPGRRLPVIEAADFAPQAAPALRHAKVGRNYHPIEKLDEFARIATAAPLGPDAVGLVKLCFVDVEPDTDARALFAEYQRRMAALRSAVPGLTLVHVTMPLTEVENWKGRLVSSLLRRPSQRGRNLVRHRYNTLLRAAYEGHEPIFDLAALESLRSDGSVAAFRAGGEAVPMLAPEHARDGAHLTPEASRRIAEQLLVLLATLPPRDGPRPAPRG